MSSDNRLEQLKCMLKNFKVEYISRKTNIEKNITFAEALEEVNKDRYNKLREDIDFEKLLLLDLDKSIKTFTELIKNVKIQNDLEKIFNDNEIYDVLSEASNNIISDEEIDKALFS